MQQIRLSDPPGRICFDAAEESSIALLTAFDERRLTEVSGLPTG
jgi:hypothetical protein